MSKELDPTDFEAVISHYNIDSLDRQQEIWDRAMPKEMADHMFGMGRSAYISSAIDASLASNGWEPITSTFTIAN